MRDLHARTANRWSAAALGLFVLTLSVGTGCSSPTPPVNTPPGQGAPAMSSPKAPASPQAAPSGAPASPQAAPSGSPASSPAAGKSVTTATGLQYEDLVVGTGAQPNKGQIVVVHYVGRLTDGTKFDASLDHGAPFEFPLGAGRVIPGWDEGVATMKVGGKRKLTVPPELAYGSRAMGNVIPPNSTLVFEVELLSIK